MSAHSAHAPGARGRGARSWHPRTLADILGIRISSMLAGSQDAQRLPSLRGLSRRQSITGALAPRWCPECKPRLLARSACPECMPPTCTFSVPQSACTESVSVPRGIAEIVPSPVLDPWGYVFNPSLSGTEAVSQVRKQHSLVTRRISGIDLDSPRRVGPTRSCRRSFVSLLAFKKKTRGEVLELFGGIPRSTRGCRAGGSACLGREGSRC